MPNFRYRALTESGEVVSGVISATTAAEVVRRIDYLRLVPIDAVLEQKSASAWRLRSLFERRARPEDVSVFTRDLALLLRTGARLDEALELLAGDIDIGRLRPNISKVRASVLAGDSLADALAQHAALFPPMYIALVRVGEASGSLDRMLEMLADERIRAEALRRKLADALRYPAFVLFAACGVLLFFLMFVLPQFAGILRDFGAQVDPVARGFLWISDQLTAHSTALATATALLLLGALGAARSARAKARLLARFVQLPLVRIIATFHRTALFSRNLAVLIAAGLPLTAALRILADTMATTGDAAVWPRIVERVRQGRKLAEALDEQGALPALAIRMLRLGEETGQLSLLAGRVAEFYESKLQRSLDRLVGIVGPAAIITISIIVGGLIVSVMTSLLSVSQLIG